MATIILRHKHATNFPMFIGKKYKTSQKQSIFRIQLIFHTEHSLDIELRDLFRINFF